MPRRPSNRPTDAELEILGVLWERGPSTVREVFREISAIRDTGYTSVLKVMQIMTEKGALVRDESVRPQVYRAAQSRAKTQKALVKDLLERAFGGEPGNLVLAALGAKGTTPEERKRIQELLDAHERDDDEGGAS